MANITVRQLPTADSLSAADTLLISQVDGTTRKIPVNRLVSEGMLASDTSGSSSMITRVKIWIGAKNMTDIYGVNRTATDEWGDKAWMLVYPGRGNSPDDLHKTDFCHFVSVGQPVPCFVLNRPFVNLHEAIVWAKYNVPGGWDLQFDICGSTNCFEAGDKLGEYGPHTLADFNLNWLAFIGKHRFVGSYNEANGSWDIGKGNPQKDTANWIRWIPDASGQGGPHSSSMNRGVYHTNQFEDRRGHNKVSGEALADIYVHFSGYSHIRMWFRDIAKVYICGITWGDYAYGPRLGNQRFFRISNGRLHMFGEAGCNLEANRHIIANQRGNSFVTKHGSSTIVECMEGGSVYIMCNLRHYSCGTTRSYYQRRQDYMTDPNNLNKSYSPRDVGLSYDAYHAAPVQIVRIAEVGGNGSTTNGSPTVVFDPLYHGWFRSLGLLCADRNTLVYHNGTTLASGGATQKNDVGQFDAGFINFSSWQHYEWLTGGHEKINDASWTHYDAEALNWYYLGVTPRGYRTEDIPGDKDPYIWDVSKASAACPWQAWKQATVGTGGTYAETIPGIVKGPYIYNNGDEDQFLGPNQAGTHLIDSSQAGNSAYGFIDNRGYRHFQRTMRSNGSIMSLDKTGQKTTDVGLFLQHYASGKNTRIVASINSPCSSAYSFGAADAKIYLAKHYSTMNYVYDPGWEAADSSNALPSVINDNYGKGIAGFSFHSTDHNGGIYSQLSGAAYPLPNTKSGVLSAFKYQECNGIVDHPAMSGHAQETPHNRPIIGGSEYLKFSDYPGRFQNYQNGPNNIGIGNAYFHQMPTIGTSEDWKYQGTWNFAQYSFSHQKYKAGSEHKFLQPIPVFNNYWATDVGNDQVMKVWFDLESRSAIHNMTNAINMRTEPYWWEEGTSYLWNQMEGTPKSQGDSNIHGENAPKISLHGVIRNKDDLDFDIYASGSGLGIGNTLALQASDPSYARWDDYTHSNWSDYDFTTVVTNAGTVGPTGSFGNGNTLWYQMSDTTLYNTYNIGKNRANQADVDMKNYELPVTFRIYDVGTGFVSRQVTSGIQAHKVERVGEYFEITWEASLNWLTDGETLKLQAVDGNSGWVTLKEFVGESHIENSQVGYKKQVVKVPAAEVKQIRVENGTTTCVFRIMNSASTRCSYSVSTYRVP